MNSIVVSSKRSPAAFALLRRRAFIAALPLVVAHVSCAAPEPGIDEEESTSALSCNGPGCTCTPTFGIGFVQQNNSGAVKGDFELVVPHAGGGFSSYYRDNATTVWSKPWLGPSVISSGDVGGVALIKSTYGGGDLHLVSTVGSALVTASRPRSRTASWSSTQTIASSGVRGQPGFLQRRSGAPGNFEVVVPLTAGGLARYTRDNAVSGTPWRRTEVFGASRVYDAVAITQNNAASGNLEVVARSGTDLWAFTLDTTTRTWSSGSRITVDGTAVRATGTHSLIQSTRGTVGHFELLVPREGGGLAHHYRNNDASGTPWQLQSVLDSGGNYTAANLIQSNYGTDTLEMVARRDGTLVTASRSSAGTWDTLHAIGAEPCCDRTTKGVWSDPVETTYVGIHASLLPNGKVLYFGTEDSSLDHGVSEVFAPTTGAVETTSFSSHMHPDLFCSGHTFLPDGRLYVAGGHHTTRNGSHTFDFLTRRWTAHTPMTSNRWYPTTARLPDGKVFVISGTQSGYRADATGSNINNTWQVFDPATNTLSPNRAITLPYFSSKRNGTGRFVPVDLYPFVYTLPNGKIMVHSRQTTRFLDASTNAWDSTAYSTVSDLSRTYPSTGTSVMLTLSPRDNYRARVLVIGGAGAFRSSTDFTTPAVASVEQLDLGAASPAWTEVAPMRFRRSMADSVLLPDGKVLVLGGSSTGMPDVGPTPVLDSEMYDPSTNTWTTLCPMRVTRGYHASAILLPDARVLVAGRDGVVSHAPYKWPEHRAEIYSPPYLFAGTRPVIASAPASVGYDRAFSVGLSTAVAGRSIARAVLMALGSYTHSFNHNQRAIQLDISTRASGSVTLQSPKNRQVAPTGHYMLFLLSDAGVPSVARFVKLQ